MNFKKTNNIWILTEFDLPRSAPCAGDWVAEDPMDLSPSTSPTINKQRLPASPVVGKNIVNNNKVAGGSSNKLAGKTASLLSAAESRSSSKVF